MSRWKKWAKIVDRLESLQEVVVDEINSLIGLHGVECAEEELQRLLKVESGIQISLRNAFLGLQKSVSLECTVTDEKKTFKEGKE